MSDKIHILLSITDSYIPYCAVTIVSIFENNINEKFCIHIICNDLTSQNKSKLEQLFNRYNQNLNLILTKPSIIQKITNIKNKIPSKYHISIFYRLFIADLLPQNIERIIYMDSDLIVTGNILPLWETEMDNHTMLCAVHDYVRIDDYYRLDIPIKEHTYFNSGVLLINLNYWRQHYIGTQCMNYIHKFPNRLIFPDQDILNVISIGKFKQLHPKYNTMSFLFAEKEYITKCVWNYDIDAVIEAIKSPIIVHFAGEKPWYKGSYLPYREQWEYYLHLTEWKNTKIKYKRGWIGWIRLKLKYPILNFLSGKWGIFITDPSFYLNQNKN